MLYLAYHERPFLRIFHIVEEILGSIAYSTTHSTATNSSRRVSTRGNSGLCLFGSVDHRHDNPVRSDIKIRLDKHRLAGAYANKSGASGSAQGNQVTLYILDGVRCVFGIYPDEIHTAIASKFARDKIAH